MRFEKDWKEKRSPRQNLFAKGRRDRNRQPDGLAAVAIIREPAARVSGEKTEWLEPDPIIGTYPFLRVLCAPEPERQRSKLLFHSLGSWFYFYGLPTAARAGVGGSISGTATDASGGAVSKAAVTATNSDTGIKQSVVTDDKGFYSFPDLPVGHYDLEVASAGFRPYRRTGIVIDANSALAIDAALEVGERSDVVTVIENQLHVETSSTQMGEVITAAQMTAVPLNGRSFTDLLALQPGVAPATSITSETVQDVGASALAPSGDLNPGTISINGQREFANSFIVNGSDVEEDVNMGAAVIPNLDSIAKFRILTSNFDAEYGEFSGGQINVVTKSGTNAFHGDVFEFLRNTDLDARNFFSLTRGVFDQNQFGGTHRRSHSQKIRFSSLRITRERGRPKASIPDQIPVPSIQDRTTGNFS